MMPARHGCRWEEAAAGGAAILIGVCRRRERIMTRAHSIWMLWLGVALLSPISASSAFALCGGVDGTLPRVPCDCGDTVGITPTILSATDAVTRKVCTAADGMAALFVSRLVNLNMKAATLRCDTSRGFIAGLRIRDG